jgi:alkaline phosphatase
MNSGSEFLEKTTIRIRLGALLAPLPEIPFRFALATDSHFSEKEALEDKHYAEALLKMEEFVKTVNEHDCAFAIHLGDFKDEDLEPDRATTLEYLGKMEREFSKFRGMRYHCLGNHDLDSITKEDFLGQVENAGITSGKGHYSFEINSLKFVVLDANFDAEGRDHFFREGGDWENPTVPEEQLTWLKNELAASPYPCMILCHHPLYGYVKNGHKYHVSNYLDVRRILEDSRKVVAVFNGHMHEEMFHEINDIQYLAMNSMLEGTFIQRNCFYVLEIQKDELLIHRFGRIIDYL